MHVGVGDVVVQEQPAEVVEVGGEVVALADPLQVGHVHPVGLQDRVQLIGAPERLVALQCHIPAVFPPRRQRELAFGLDRPAPAAEVGVERGDRGVLDGGDVDDVLSGGEPMAPLAGPQHAAIAEVVGTEREVVVGREGEIVWDLDRGAQR